MDKRKKLLITGGHAATTAYAVMQDIKRQKKDWELFWIGAKTTVEGAKTKNFEKELFLDYNVENYHITAGKLQFKANIASFISILKIPIGFINATYLVAKINPDAVLSFGGYVSFPVVVISRILGKPIVIHEQTSAAGLANIKSSRFASIIAISRKSSEKYFPSEKCVITGNPVNNKISTINPKRNINKIPVILVTGGSRGARIINNTIFESIKELTENYKIIHLTGDLDFKKAQETKNKLKNKNRYEIFDFVSPEKMADLFQKADIVISRAGANTVSEIITSSRPAILIPIPWSHYNEQFKNARYAEKSGAAHILEEKDLNKSNLIKVIHKVIKNWNKMLDIKSEILIKDEKASEKLIDLIEKII